MTHYLGIHAVDEGQTIGKTFNSSEVDLNTIDFTNLPANTHLQDAREVTFKRSGNTQNMIKVHYDDFFKSTSVDPAQGYITKTALFTTDVFEETDQYNGWDFATPEVFDDFWFDAPSYLIYNSAEYEVGA